ncbi:Uncharacterised protein [Vibrio cholerae]|nr:Uncharacterised protein [Vibrio cholerae]
MAMQHREFVFTGFESVRIIGELLLLLFRQRLMESAAHCFEQILNKLPNIGLLQ